MAGGFLIFKSFQNFNKPGISDHGIIGDNWQVKISGGYKEINDFNIQAKS